MGEQMPDPDDAVAGDLQPVVGDRAVQVDGACLHQLHHDRGGERLGQRGQMIGRVGRRLYLVLDVCVAKALRPCQLLVLYQRGAE
ncbi:MAG: hypothetical protein AMS25_12450 [Gemmatimonas sp. SM23_52]|nr:MAG: hypothetical protein AMS25_12450 [Gemmatimonas sp. SM23_52]